MKSATLIYLHGMNSSPDSSKARAVIDYANRFYPTLQCVVPQQEVYPNKTATLLLNVAESLPANHSIFLIGSSLGGYYATFLREKLFEKYSALEVRMVLINPAVRPYQLFEDYLGIQVNEYTGERYELTMKHVSQLEALDIEHITAPDQILLMVQTGDEVLHYQDSLNRYQGVNMNVTEGGSHAFDHFEQVLPRIFRFLYNK